MILLWIVAYGLIYSVLEQISNKIGDQHILTAAFLVAYVVVVWVFLHRRKQLAYYGIRIKVGWTLKNLLILLPTLVFAGGNMFFAGGVRPIAWQVVLMTACATMLEEFFFRGYLLVKLMERFTQGTQGVAIVLSSVVFGLFHLVNLLGNADLKYTVVQAICAGSFGVLLCMIRLRIQTIVPGMCIHLITNLTALQRTDHYEVEFPFLLIASAFCLIYSYWLYSRHKILTGKER